ncbi:autotransporter domain-containing protein [Brucella gallinifaecis]|uniref:Autotransporter domain-containing protein n=1 Tax=Brucella gallinifaecis TaxID=215590 RepID=A0A502BN19_9HYPH|nr:autotransporter domain-containing protein [Brucella gallinifaecis]TPF74463.1 autotransporter domain-containing protein [Brucella gallinifaecis]
MKILSRNAKLVLGSTAIVVVLSGAVAFSADGTVVNGAAYTLAKDAVDNISGQTYKAETSGASSKRAWGVLVHSNSTLDVSNVVVETKGSKAHGIQVGASGGKNYTGNDASLIRLGSGVSVETSGSDSFGLHAIDGGSISGAAKIVTVGKNGFGAFAESGSEIALDGADITTSGVSAHGIIANNDQDVDAGKVSASNSVIKTTGTNATGAYADDGGLVTLTDTVIETTGLNAYGVFSTERGQADVKGGSITTDGKRGYGLLAIKDGTITSNADITTNGEAAHAVQAGGNGTNSTVYDGSTAGTVNLTGGTITVNAQDGTSWATALHAVDQGVINADNVRIVSKSYGAIAESASTINIANSEIVTSGKDTSALVANNDRKSVYKDQTAQGGVLNVVNTNVTTSGAYAHGVVATYGGSVTLDGGTITTTGDQASSIAVVGSSRVEVKDTSLSSENAATVSVLLNSDADVADIVFGKGTVATVNNGTLLQVNRVEGGLDGTVNFTLDAGSQSKGDIVDEAEDKVGQTNFFVKEGASWTGSIRGIKDITTEKGSTLNFGENTSIAGNLVLVGSKAEFHPEGAFIAGDLTLHAGSSTKGGHNTPIILGGDALINPQSVLGGNWIISGNVTSNGSIGPGNSLGVITVGKDLTLGSESTYLVEIDKNGNSDRIEVNGTANLAGSVKVTPLDGYKIGSAYTILTANSFGGTKFDNVEFSEDLVFIDPELSYTKEAEQVAYRSALPLDKQEVQLTLSRNDVAFSSVAETANQAATADALDSLNLQNTLVNSVSLLDASGARQAFEQLSGDSYASNKSGLIETSHLSADAINERLRGAFDGVAATNVPALSYAKVSKSSGAQAIDRATSAEASNSYALWATGFGSWVNQSGNDNAGGLKTSVGGFISGVDFALQSNWRLGIAGGYSKTDLDGKNRSSSATSDNWHLGIYGGNQWDAIGLRLGLVQSWHKIDASRSVWYSGFEDSLSADYNARSLQAFGEVGYRIDTASASFEPFANLSHISLRTNGFTEQGGNAALSVEKDTTNTTFTTLGLRAASTIALGATNAKLTGTLGWRHAYGDIIPSSLQSFGGSQAFSVDGVAIAKDVAVLGAGFEVDLSKISTLGINYSGQYGNGAKQNGFNATLNVRF